MSERLLLEGQFGAKVRKIGAAGLIIAGLSGVATYVVVKKREGKVKDYFNSLSNTSPSHKATNARLAHMVYGGRADKLESLAKDIDQELVDDFNEGIYLLNSELFAMENVEPKAMRTVLQMYKCAVRSGEQLPEYSSALDNARAKLKESMKQKKFAPDSVINKMIVQHRTQARRGWQEEAMPLAAAMAPTFKIEYE